MGSCLHSPVFSQRLRVGREKKRRGGVGHGKSPVSQGGDGSWLGKPLLVVLLTKQKESGNVC